MANGRTPCDSAVDIPGGDLSLALGLIAIAAATELRSKRHAAVLVVGAVAGLVGSMLTGTRGGWIALAVAVCVFLRYSVVVRNRLVIALASAAVLMLVGAYLIPETGVRARIEEGMLDVREYRERGVALHGLTSFIGLEHEILRIDVLAVPVRSGDRLLLCTDGVTGMIDDAAVETILRETEDPRDAADRLVAAAVSAGGEDNATAVVVDVVGLASDSARDSRRHRENLEEKLGAVP